MKQRTKQTLGRALMIGALLDIGIFAFAITAYRFTHETLTETQLMIWAFQQWYWWAPAVPMLCVSSWFIHPNDKDPAVVKMDAPKTTCRRCESDLNERSYCTSMTCPFDRHIQPCPSGWIGHPEWPPGNCLCHGR